MTEASDLINKIAERKRYSSYLEIGCFQDETFSKIEMPSKIGVDPESGGTRKMTSDEFFLDYSGGFFDLIFIDGLHEQAQVLRDVKNSLTHLQADGTILIHDCLPKEESNQFNTNEFMLEYGRLPPDGKAWNGDVWKAMVEIRSWHEVDSCTLDVDWGFGVVIKRDNTQLLHTVPAILDWEIYRQRKYELLRIADQEFVFEFLGI